MAEDSMESVFRRIWTTRLRLVLYYSVIFCATTVVLVGYNIFVPQNHLQDRLTIWATSPEFVLRPQRIKVNNISQSIAGRQEASLNVANRLKRELFSDESLTIRRRTRQWRNATSRFLPIEKPSRIRRRFAFRDLSLTLEERVEDLVSQMTVEEVIQQTTVEYGKAAPGIERLGVRPFAWVSECLQGRRSTSSTAFPQPLGMAASFSPELVRNVSNAIAFEIRAQWNGNSNSTFHGLNCFGPAVNVMRHPLWARNQETFGEDPYLIAKMIHAFLIGLQGNNQRYIRVSAGCQHLVAHTGSANGDSPNIKVSDRDLWMTYLPQFRTCVLAGAQTIMCGANKINQVSPCTSRSLLTTLLRETWGFTGSVVSDASAFLYTQRKKHNKRNLTDTAAAAVRAGCNVEVSWGKGIYGHQKDALAKGQLTEEEIRNNVKPMFVTRMRLGEFDPPMMSPFSDIRMSDPQLVKHGQQAVVAAMMSFVLLKNANHTLPLAASRHYTKIAVVGPFANRTVSGVGGPLLTSSSNLTVTPLEGLSRMGPTAHARGCGPECLAYDGGSVRRCVERSDIVFVCLGAIQGFDRGNFSLPGKQLQLLKDVAKWKKRVPLVLLLFSGGPVDISWAKSSPAVNAILSCFISGQATGAALRRTLTRTGRKSVPAARLPFTWPASEDQILPADDYSMTGRTYRFLESEPLYPFGFGLSYSQFKYTDLSLYPVRVSPGTDITVTVSLVNLGPFGAEEVIQVYMSWGGVAALAPRLQLVGFQRTYLNVGRTYKYKLTVRADQMALWIDDHVTYAILPGRMTIHVGGQQPSQSTNVGSNTLSASFTILPR